jgi:putative peptidoglycan lipid II flippase
VSTDERDDLRDDASDDDGRTRRPAPLPPSPYRSAPPREAPSADALRREPAPAPEPAGGEPAERVAAVRRPLPPLPPRPGSVPPRPAAVPPQPVPPPSAAPGRPPVPPRPAPGDRWMTADEHTVIITSLPPVPPPARAPDDELRVAPPRPGGHGLLRAAGTMAVATLVSRITGLLRTVVIAAALGAGLVGDAYQTANTLPNIVYELLLGGVLSSVIVPLLVHAQERDGDGGTGYAQRLLTLATAGLVVVTGVAVLAAPLLTRLYGIQDDPEQVELANWLARILLVEIVFYGLGALAQAVLNSRDVFGPPAWAPVLNNLVVIATGLLLIAASGPGELTGTTIAPGLVWVLGIGTTLGIAVQALVLLPRLRRAGVPLRPRWGVKETGLREAGTLSLWVIGYVAVSQVGVVVATRIANEAGREGGLGSLGFANASLLFQMPYGIIGVALLTALLPRMSRAASRHDLSGVVDDLSLGTRLSALGLLPVTAALTVLGPFLGVVAFARGNTTTEQAAAMGTALAVGAFGLLPMAVTLLQLRVFYAMKDARTPTLIQIGMVAVRVPLLLLVPALVGPEHVVAGLMLATSVTYVAGWVLGQVALRRRVGALRSRATLLPVATVAAVSAAAGLLGWLVLRLVDSLVGDSVAGSLAALVIGTVVIGVAAVSGLVLARVPEIREPLAAARARLGRG